MLNRYTYVLAAVLSLFISSTSYASMIDITSYHQPAHIELHQPQDAMGFTRSRMNHELPRHHRQNFNQVVIESEITTVPVPAAAWLFISGVMGLITIARRKKEHAKA